MVDGFWEFLYGFLGFLAELLELLFLGLEGGDLGE